MATKETELDVDFIGGQDKLTVEEEKAISDFLKKHRVSSKRIPSPKKAKPSKKTKATA